MLRGKRDLLAGALCGLGLPQLLGRVPSRDVLVVLNYHRIGDPRDDEFDPGVFSATAGEFDEQISYLKREGALVPLAAPLAYTYVSKTTGGPR